MTQMDYYQALQNRKNDIEQNLARRRENLTQPMSESLDELSLYDQHPGDVASDTYEREKDLGLVEMLEYELEKVNAALQSYAAGTYGICQQCGAAIEPARLQRIVNTTLCAGCARSQSGASPRRPAEEDVIPAQRMFDRGFDVAGYDVFK